MVFQSSFMVFHGFLLVSMVFCWFPWFFKVVSWFLLGVHGFSKLFHGFWLVSIVFQGGFMVFHGYWLVSMVFHGGFMVFHGF